jgi:stringent starvation protein B
MKYRLLEGVLNAICDAGNTPYVKCSNLHPNYRGPEEYAVAGFTIHAIGGNDVTHFGLDENGICFRASYKGVAQDVTLPLDGISALYAKEDPEMGLHFDVADEFRDVFSEQQMAAEQQAVTMYAHILQLRDKHEFFMESVETQGEQLHEKLKEIVRSAPAPAPAPAPDESTGFRKEAHVGWKPQVV